MPYREKVAWISFGVMLSVYGVYFGAILAGRLSSHSLGALEGLALANVAAVVLQLALRAGAARLDRSGARGPLDEREQLIDLKATRIAFYAMAVAVLAAVFVVIHVPLSGRHASLPDMGLTVLAGLVFGDLVRSTAKIVYFRRDA